MSMFTFKTKIHLILVGELDLSHNLVATLMSLSLKKLYLWVKNRLLLKLSKSQGLKKHAQLICHYNLVHLQPTLMYLKVHSQLNFQISPE